MMNCKQKKKSVILIIYLLLIQFDLKSDNSMKSRAGAVINH